MKKYITMLTLALAMCLPWAVTAQDLGMGYAFSTGVDATKWRTAPSTATRIINPGAGDYGVSALTNIGFSFSFGGNSYTQFSVSADGQLRFGATAYTTSYTTPFQSASYINNNGPAFISAMGCDGYMASNGYAKYWLEGTAGERVLTVELLTSTYNSDSRAGVLAIQFQLYEDSNKVMLVYGTAPSIAPAVTTQIGMASSTSDIVLFNPTTGVMTAYTAPTSATNAIGTWPAAGRWFAMAVDPSICLPPTNLAYTTGADATEVTVEWTGTASSYTYTYSSSDFTAGDPTLSYTTTSDTSAVLSGLTPNTVYTFALQSTCSDGDTSRWTTFNFRTPCVDLTANDLPYFYNFNDATGSGSSSNIDPCWTRHRVGTTTAYPYTSTSYSHSAPYSMYFYSSSSTSSWLELPAIDPSVDISSLTVAFWAYRTSTSSYGHVGVGVMGDASDPTTLDTIATMQVSAASTWEYYEVPLSSYTGTGGSIVICALPQSSDNYVYIDDVTLLETPACLRPDGVTADNSTIDGATIHIADAGNTGTYRVVVMSGSDTVADQTVYDTVYTLTGLNSSSTYAVYVSALCSDGSATTSVSTSFSTLCGPISTLPWSESFEAYTSATSQAQINCWDYVHSGTNSSNYAAVVSASARAHSGNKCLRFNGNGNGTSPLLMILPEFSDDISGLEMTLWAVSENSSSSGTLVVGYVTPDSTFVPTATFTASSATTSRFLVEALFAGAPTGSRIAIGQLNTDNYWWWVDDIDVHAAPLCSRPTVTISDLAATSATFDISDANNVNSYIVVLHNDTTLVDSTTTSGNSYTFSTLTPNTAYTVTVYTACSDGTVTRATTVSFRTPCVAYATEDLPFEENFDGVAGATSGTSANVFAADCWTVVNRYGTYYPYASTSQHHSGANALYFYTSSTGNTHLSMPAFEASLESLELSFWARVATSGYGVEVGVMSDPNDVTTFVPVDTCAPSATSTWEEFVIHFPSGATGYIAFRNLGGSNGTRTTYIDDINVHLAPACDRIEGFTVSGVTAYTADIHIVDPTYEANYVIVASSTTDTVTTTATDTLHTVVGLQPNTEYTFTVYTICSDGATTAPRVSPVYRTACAPIQQLPWVENFDSYSDYYTSSGSMPGGMIPCWEFLRSSNSDYMQFVNQTSSYSRNYETGTAGYSLKFYPGNSTSQAIVVMPEFEEQLSSLELMFWTRPEGTSSSPGSLSVGYISDVTDNSTFVALQTYSYSEFSGAYQPRFVGFPADAPAGSRIAFRHNTASSNWYWFIDDIDVHLAPTCQRAQGISVRNITTNSVEVVIADSNFVGDYTVTIIGGNDTVSENITDTIHSFSNLAANTDYTVSMVTNCSDGITTYPYTATFTTLCLGFEHDSLPWSENFNSYTGNTSAYESNRMDPECWTILNRYSANYPYYNNSSTYNPNGGNCVYTYVSGSAQPVMVLPPFEDTPDQLMLSMDVYVSSLGNNIEVGVITNPADASTFSPVTTFAPTATSVWQHFEATFAGRTEGLLALRHGSGTVYFDNLVVDALPACVTPSQLVFSDVDSVSATVTIADANNTNHYMLYWGESDSIEITTNTYTLTDLSFGTSYTVSARTICGDGTMTDVISASFTTSCGLVNSLPWLEDFESYALETSTLNCYNQLPTTVASGVNQVTNAHASSGTNSWRFSGYATKPKFLILPTFAADLQTLMLNMWIYSENRGSSGKLMVGYITDIMDSTTFVPTAIFDAADTAVNYNQMNNVDVTFAGAPAGARIAIAQQNNNANYWWWIDDVMVLVAPSCSRPTALEATNITSTSADINITDTGNAGSYYYILSDGTTSDTNTVNASVISLTNLQSGTYYEIKVASLCSDGNVTPFASTRFFTDCAPLATLPWTEDFETWGTGSSNVHPCWSRFYHGSSSIVTNSYPYVSSSATSAHSGSHYMYNYTYHSSSSNYYSVFYLPEFQADINNLSVAFFLFANSSSNYANVRVAVGVSDSATTDTSTFTRLATFAPTQNAWEEFEVDLSAYTNTTGRITFLVYGTSASYIYPYIDDITVNTLANCRRPSSITVTNVLDSEATISWVDATSAGSYNVTLYDATGAVVGSTVTVTDTFYTVTGLTSITNYTVGVSSNCSGTATTERTAHFRTTCAPVATLPWTEDFESYTGGSSSGTTTVFADPCWQVLNRYSSNYPYVTTSYAHTGSNGVSIYSYGGNNGTIMVYPVFATPTDSLYVSLWARASSTSYGLEFGYMTDAGNPSSFVSTYTWIPAASSTWTELHASFAGAPAGSRIAMRYASTSTSTGTVYVDDITVDVLDFCTEDVTARVLRTTGDSVVLDWTVGLGLVGDVTVNILSATGTPVSSITSAEAPLAIGGLSAETEYQAVVSINCNGTVSAADTIDFSTRCFGGTEHELSAATLNLTASVTHYTPIGSYYNHSTSEQIFLASELGNQAMNITSVSFSYNYGTPLNGSYTGRIYLMATTDSLLTTSMPVPDSTTMQLVYSGPLNMEQGWNEFVFTSSFAYDGDSNLLLAIVADGAYVGSQDRFNTHNVPSGRAAYYNNDNNNYSAGVTATLLTKRCDVKFATCSGSAPVTYTVSAASANATMGTATVSPNGQVAENTSVTFTATANDGYHFVSWTDATGAVVSTANPYTVTVTADLALTANFEANPSDVTYYTVSAASADAAMGTASVSPNGQVAENTSVTFTATANDGYHFVSWTDATGAVVSTANPYTVTVSADLSLTANFEANGSQPVECEAPANVTANNISASGANINWTAVEGATGYEIEYGAENFTDNTGTLVQSATTSVALSGLTADMNYHVHVRSLCADGNHSDWSARTLFRTLENQGIDDIDASSIALYPNPATTSVTLSGIAGQATVSVVDMNGRVSGTWNVENGELTIDLTGYAQGAYFVRITGEQQTAIRKLIVK